MAVVAPPRGSSVSVRVSAPGGGGGGVKSLPLHRVQLPHDVRVLLQARGIETAAQLLTMTEVELREKLDVSIEEVRSIVQAVSRKVCPASQTALQLAEKSRSAPRALRVGDAALDGMLRGGFSAGTLTEVVGQAGMGKTQLCLSLAVTAALPESAGGSGGHALYIDTESRFNTTRMLELAASKYPDSFGTKEQADALARSVLVSRPRSCAELMTHLSDLQSFVIEHSIKCIIVDSVAALPRSEFSNEHIIERQEMLGRQAIALKAVAEAFSIPVVVTNQVTTRIARDGTGDYTHLTAALGTKWSHCVNTRVTLHQPHEDEPRYMEVTKSPFIPRCNLPYVIGAAGISVAETHEPMALNQSDIGKIPAPYTDDTPWRNEIGR